VLDEGGWAVRLNVSHRDLGSGMTEWEVDDFNERINVAELLSYRGAVGQRTQEIVGDLRSEVLREAIDSDLIQQLRKAGAFGSNAEWVPQRWEGKQKAFTLMHTVLAHSYLHIGQCEDVRSLLGFQTL
jgi:hypothetical protein